MLIHISIYGHKVSGYSNIFLLCTFIVLKVLNIHVIYTFSSLDTRVQLSRLKR